MKTPEKIFEAILRIIYYVHLMRFSTTFNCYPYTYFPPSHQLSVIFPMLHRSFQHTIFFFLLWESRCGFFKIETYWSAEVQFRCFLTGISFLSKNKNTHRTCLSLFNVTFRIWYICYFSCTFLYSIWIFKKISLLLCSRVKLRLYQQFFQYI